MKYRSIFIFLIILMNISSLLSQIQNPGFTGKPLAPDSSLWNPQYHSIPLISDFTSLGFEVTAPSADHFRTPYYDSRAVMPDNLLFLDSRGSSYYVPRQVSNRIAHIMNRPTANEVVPLFAVAALAAKLALQHVTIENIIRIDARDYILDEKYFPIMLAAWEHSPQKAPDLYKLRSINTNRSYEMLVEDLNYLVDRKLLKIKVQEKGPAFYYVAQTKQEAKQSISEAIANNSFTERQRQKLEKLLELLDLFKVTKKPVLKKDVIIAD